MLCHAAGRCPVRVAEMLEINRRFPTDRDCNSVGKTSLIGDDAWRLD